MVQEQRSMVEAVEGGEVDSHEKKQSPCFQIVGTREMLEGIQLQLIKYLNLKKTKLTKNTPGNANHYALRYRGRFQTIRIFDWLYLNQKHYLKRKHNRYLDIKRRLNLSKELYFQVDPAAD